MKPATLLHLLLLPLALAQHSPTPNGCAAGYYPGRDEVLYTVPYTYTQVLSIIGSYQNLTWSGNPPSTVALSGPDNTVGTTRTYDIAGAHVIETITLYSKPAQGPYVEVHTLAPLSIPAANNVSFYGDFDGTTVTPVCGGRASAFNFTIVFCANNATLAASVLHGIHLQDAVTVGVFLGGKNFSTCAALGGVGNGTGSGSGSGGNSSAVPFTGDAGMLRVSVGAFVLLGGAAALAAALVW